MKLGKKHKQYYERRLKFLEGKISIYEAAQDVKEAKLAQRLQKEFLLENRIQVKLLFINLFHTVDYIPLKFLYHASLRFFFMIL